MATSIPLPEGPVSVSALPDATAARESARRAKQAAAALVAAKPPDGESRLYALLDAAISPQIPEMLRATALQHEILYEGDAAEEMADFGPYLICMDARADVLSDFVAESWGKSWGFFLYSRLAFADLRRALRRFIMVRLPDGRSAYFRFYDPRVLRVFLPSCNAQEAASFMRGIDVCIMELPAGAGILEARCEADRVVFEKRLFA